MLGAVPGSIASPRPPTIWIVTSGMLLDPTVRWNGASGGSATWMLETLLGRGLVDGGRRRIGTRQPGPVVRSRPLQYAGTGESLQPIMLLPG